MFVGTAGSPPHRSSAIVNVDLSLPVTTGYMMPNFQHNLMRIGPLCDHGCPVVFEKTKVTIFSKDNIELLRSWRETTGSKLWRFSLRPGDHHSTPPDWSKGPTALNAHELSSVGTLVRYLHADAGFPVKSTWLEAIKAGNYSSWPGLTYANASKYCPISVESVKSHLTQSRQDVCSTKTKPRPDLEPVPIEPMTKSKELFIRTAPTSKLYTDDMGSFPVRSRSGNNFIMLAYHVDTNVILVEPFASRHDRHSLAATDCIMANLAK